MLGSRFTVKARARGIPTPLSPTCAHSNSWSAPLKVRHVFDTSLGRHSRPVEQSQRATTVNGESRVDSAGGYGALNARAGLRVPQGDFLGRQLSQVLARHSDAGAPWSRGANTVATVPSGGCR